jgi:hypothetical protein
MYHESAAGRPRRSAAAAPAGGLPSDYLTNLPNSERRTVTDA